MSNPSCYQGCFEGQEKKILWSEEKKPKNYPIRSGICLVEHALKIVHPFWIWVAEWNVQQLKDCDSKLPLPNIWLTVFFFFAHCSDIALQFLSPCRNYGHLIMCQDRCLTVGTSYSCFPQDLSLDTIMTENNCIYLRLSLTGLTGLRFHWLSLWKLLSHSWSYLRSHF